MTANQPTTRAALRNRTLMRCQLAGKHRWEPVGDENELDTGRRCRDPRDMAIVLCGRAYDPCRHEPPDLDGRSCWTIVFEDAAHPQKGAPTKLQRD